MLKKISLKENDVVSIKVNATTYTLGQMRTNGIMQFFDIFRTSNEWDGVILNDVPSLFFIFVAEKSLSPIFVEKVSSELVIPSAKPVLKTMLSAVIGNHGDHGANLIELTDAYSSYGATIVKKNLDKKIDLELIYRYELAGIYGDSEKIRNRLEIYCKTGVNWDISKEFLFKDILPPPPNYGKDTPDVKKY